MLKIHLRIALRNILKQRIYNSLNVIGLATAIACGLVIALHIQEELSYEKDFPQYENIYRIHVDQWAKSSPPMALEIVRNIPEMQTIGRFAADGTHVVNTDNNNPGEVTGYFADSTMLDVFSLKVIDGDRKQVLATEGTIVITQSMATRYFGAADPIGKVLEFDNKKTLQVGAVIQDLPRNSHLKFDYLVPMAAFYKQVPPDWASKKGWMVMYTYVRFASEHDYHKVRSKWQQFLLKYYEGHPETKEKVAQEELKFMALKDIHLKSNMEQEMGANSSILYIYIFIAVEVLILIIACANFMSLFTTQAIKRMKEVGMHKIMGAKPLQLMSQFFTEVILLTIVSLILAVILYQVVLPFYNDVSGKSLGVWQLFEGDNLIVIAGILLFIVIFSGLYPAFFIARFKSGSFLRENKLPNSIPSRVRGGLVVFQFVVSISLIAAAIIVQQQMDLMRNKDLGFDKDQVVNIRLYGTLLQKISSETEIVKNELFKNPDILSVGRTGNIIGDHLSVEGVVPEGKEAEGDKYPSVRVMRVDEGYLDAMGMTLVAGRNFSANFNDSSSFVINESAAKMMGLTDPVGKRINNMSMNRIGTVVGVVKDYHFTSLHSAIEPLVMEYKPDWTGYLTVKLRAGKTTEALAYIRRTVNAIAPGSLFTYDFLDDHLDQLYRSEDSMGKVFQFFSILAIIIACLGLLGLSAFTIESRTKEIGIRKVLGATVAKIVTMVSSKFFRLVLIAFAIAVPLTWYSMNRWLQNFAYQIEIQWWVFGLTGGLIFIIALAVVSFHTVSAAMKNPVRSLRYE
jgi:putative ABC transport system permease protein